MPAQIEELTSVGLAYIEHLKSDFEHRMKRWAGAQHLNIPPTHIAQYAICPKPLYLNSA